MPEVFSADFQLLKLEPCSGLKRPVGVSWISSNTYPALTLVKM